MLSVINKKLIKSAFKILKLYYIGYCSPTFFRSHQYTSVQYMSSQQGSRVDVEVSKCILHHSNGCTGSKALLAYTD